VTTAPEALTKPTDAACSQAATPAEVTQVADLHHQIALRDDFIATAARELRNPLSPVYMQLEHLKETLRAMPEPIAKPWLTAQLDAMTARLDRFLHALNRLLDATRIGDGHLALLPEPCDLVEITRAVLAASQRELQAAACAVTLDAPDTLSGSWDRFRLEQIIGNLISNAARYGTGQPITIRITAAPGEAHLQVIDRGIGIPADDLARIFGRFERADNAGRSTGLGLGLWIVAEVCRAMGGRIEVESVPGEGTTFSLTLPRKAS
jgi:signal transduction histidine kinase